MSTSVQSLDEKIGASVSLVFIILASAGLIALSFIEPKWAVVNIVALAITVPLYIYTWVKLFRR